MASRRQGRLPWRAVVGLAAIALVVAGVWVWQPGGSTPDYEVAVVAPQADEALLIPGDLPVAPVGAALQSATPSASQPRGAAFSLQQQDAAPPAASPGDKKNTQQSEPAPDNRSETAEPPSGQTYTYWDGDALRTVTLAPTEGGSGHGGPDDFQDGAGGASDDAAAAPLVFRTESGVEMTLEHSIVLVLNPDWSRADVDRFLVRNGIRMSNVTPMGWMPNGFTISTGPGVAPLVLANSLATQDGVVMSSPNWASEFEVR